MHPSLLCPPCVCVSSNNLRPFPRRSDLSGKLESKLKVETLLVTGAKASHVHTVHTMHQSCNKQKASLLKIDDVGDVLAECVSVGRDFVVLRWGRGVESVCSLPFL